MVNVKAPDVYINEPNAFVNGGLNIAEIGNKLFIIGGQTALTVAQPLIESLKAANVTYQLHTFTGYCTKEQIEAYAAQAAAADVNVIVGIGGGRVLDLIKAVAERVQLPSVTVPTVPATCAAWSALTVLYDDEGRSAGYLPLKRAPQLVLADTTVLAAAPRRYLASGIGDTYVKWNETVVNVKNVASDLDIRIGAHTADFAVDLLNQYAQEAYDGAGNGAVSQAFHEVSHAIIWLAGQVGSISGNGRRGALAHAIHDSLTQFPQTRQTLHGEKVAFGLVAHTILQGLAEEETTKLATALHKLGLPVTLQQLGIQDAPAEAALAIAQGVPLEAAQAADLPFTVSTLRVAEAIAAADKLGQHIRNPIHSNH